MNREGLDTLIDRLADAMERKDAVALGTCAQILEQAITASIAASADDIDILTFHLGLCTTDTSTYPEARFQYLLDLMQTQGFQDSLVAHHLLSCIQQEWDRLSANQRVRLLPVLEWIYPHLKDWMGWFLISEFLGQQYRDQAALDAVVRLRASSSEGPRSLLPHALQHMITDSPNEDLVRQATAELQDMTRDPSAKVLAEVEERQRIVAARQARE
jgi:integrase